MSTLVPNRPSQQTRPTPLRRVLALSRANATLLVRNRTTFSYALVIPLVPLALLFLGGDGDQAGAQAITSTLLMGALFPVYYSTLSQVVTRRDELVLKRLRTGECSDREIVASIALPGIVIALAVAVLAVPIAMLGGQRFPSDPVVYLLGALVVAVVFSALAFWTAAWTRNAEAAQITSLPVIMLAVAGSLAPVMPDRVAAVLDRTPGGALAELVDVGWYAGGGLADALAPLVVLAAWTALAVALAARSMTWEPRH